MALIATALVVVLLVQGALSDDGGDSGGPSGGTTSETETGTCAGDEPDAAEAVEDGYYVLEEGEDLTNVADRTCIPVEELQELNPNLDPLSLPVGGCVDLVVDGCKALAQS